MLLSGDKPVAGEQHHSRIRRTTSSGAPAESVTIGQVIVTSRFAKLLGRRHRSVELAAAYMRETKPDDALSAADALDFLVTPRAVTVTAPAAAPAREIALPATPPENAYAEADKASYRHLET